MPPAVGGTYSAVVPPADGLFLRINQFARETAWLHGPAAAYAMYGIALFAGLIVVGWWLARSTGPVRMACALLTPVAALVAVGVQQLVVSRVHEARPYAVFPQALVLVSKTADPSFPSDHACAAGAVAAGLFFVDRRLGWVTAGFAALMAVTRVYVGAHWPLDVVAGLALGAAVAIVVVLVLRRPVARLVTWLRATTLRPLVGIPAS